MKKISKDGRSRAKESKSSPLFNQNQKSKFEIKQVNALEVANKLYDKHEELMKRLEKQ